MILVALLLLQSYERTALGAWDRWAAFADRDPPRCYAITASASRGRFDTRGGFASVSFRHGQRAAAVYLRFSIPRLASAPVRVTIGQRRFTLTGDARTAWSPSPAIDRAVIGAMRGGAAMSVTSIAASGRPFTETYALAGAATAIDAASIACVG